MLENPIEFSRILDVNAVGNAVKEHKLIAKPEERKALTKRFGVLHISLFEVIYVVEKISNKTFKISGRLKAELEQPCIVTSKPIQEKIDEEFDVVLRPRNPDSNPIDDLDLSALNAKDEEEIELAPSGKIDMGEVVTQYLALSLNPYPRHEGSEFSDKDSKKTSKTNPFDILKDLK